MIEYSDSTKSKKLVLSVLVLSDECNGKLVMGPKTLKVCGEILVSL